MEEVQLFPVTYGRAELDKVPRDELELFLISAHAADDLNIIRKMLIASISGLESPIDREVSMVQAMFLIRSMVVRLVSAWDLLKQQKYQALFHKAVEAEARHDGTDKTCAEARHALAELPQLFIEQGVIDVLRKKAGAHTDRAKIMAAYDRLPEDLKLTDYLARIRGNTIYSGVEQITARAALDVTGHAEASKAMEALAEPILEAQGQVGDLLELWLNHFYQSHLEQNVSDGIADPKAVPEVPKLDDIRLPFFVSA